MSLRNVPLTKFTCGKHHTLMQHVALSLPRFLNVWFKWQVFKIKKFLSEGF